MKWFRAIFEWFVGKGSWDVLFPVVVKQKSKKKKKKTRIKLVKGKRKSGGE